MLINAGQQDWSWFGRHERQEEILLCLRASSYSQKSLILYPHPSPVQLLSCQDAFVAICKIRLKNQRLKTGQRKSLFLDCTSVISAEGELIPGRKRREMRAITLQSAEIPIALRSVRLPAK